MNRVYIILACISIFSFELSSQCVKGNCNNGKGIYIFKSGAKYDGKFKNGRIYDYGTLYFSNGSVYVGQWKNQRRSGQGQIKYKDGSTYSGNFENNKRSGFGKLTTNSGAIYEGEWENDLQHGIGIYTSEDGHSLKSKWINGEPEKKSSSNAVLASLDENSSVKIKKFKDCNRINCGNSEGRYTYLDGSYFEGDFKNGLPEGNGICYYANGDRYEGGWKNNAPHGEGVMYFEAGTVYGAIWNGGYPIKKINASQKPKVQRTNQQNTNLVEHSKEVKIWAVIVGIASYNHMPTLKYTDDDAYQIYAFLKSPEGGAIPDERIALLIDESATRKSILSQMENTFSKADENDVIMLYYSGHGLPGSFLPIDFDGYNNIIQHHEVKEILEKSKAKHKICFADACHSGSLLAMKSPFNATRMNSFFDGFENASAGTALFTSSKSEEVSMETSGLRQGIYSHYLIRGLGGEADYDGNKIVTIDELYRFVNRNVRSYTSNRQTPVIAGNYDGNMPVSIVR